MLDAGKFPRYLHRNPLSRSREEWRSRQFAILPRNFDRDPVRLLARADMDQLTHIIPHLGTQAALLWRRHFLLARIERHRLGHDLQRRKVILSRVHLRCHESIPVDVHRAGIAVELSRHTTFLLVPLTEQQWRLLGRWVPHLLE